MSEVHLETKAIYPRAGWVLYDGGCGFCFRWVHLWEKVIERRGFALKDLQSAWADGSLQISQQHLLDDIRVLVQTHIFLWRKKFGGHGHFTQSSVFLDSIGCFGVATVGSIVIDTGFLAIAHYRNKPIQEPI
jgi:hypothetical protein